MMGQNPNFYPNKFRRLPLLLINIPGQAMSGRFVIVQMDNGNDVPLNLEEVKAFGESGNMSMIVISNNMK